MSKNLNKHIKSDKAKWAITSIVLVLVVVMLVGMCLQLFGQGKVKPSEWFDKSPVENGEVVEIENNLHYSAFTPTVLSDSPATYVEGETTQNGILEATRELTLSNKGDGLVLLLEYLRASKYGQVLDYSLEIDLRKISGDFRILINSIFGFRIAGGSISLTIADRDIGETCPLPELGYSFYIRILRDSNSKFNVKYVSNVNSFEFDAFISGASEFKNELNRYFDSFVYEVCVEPIPVDIQFLNGTGEVASDGLIEHYRRYGYTETELPLPPAPTKEGYIFTGWYIDEACTQKYTGTTITSDTVLYAGWQQVVFTVSFNSDGGSAVENQNVEMNSSVVLKTPTKEGYSFEGWYLPNGTRYTNQPIKEDINLKAKWKILTFSVAFNSSGGNDIVDQTVNYGKSVIPVIPVRKGFNFMGWYLPNDTEYTGQAITSNTVLTAKWEIKRFTVVFYVDGEVYNEMTVDYGTRLKDVADRAEVYAQNVVSYRFMNVDLPIGDFGDMVVVDDMEVEANAPSESDKVIGTIKNNWLSIVLGGAGLIAVIAIISFIASRKKRH